MNGTQACRGTESTEMQTPGHVSIPIEPPGEVHDHHDLHIHNCHDHHDLHYHDHTDYHHHCHNHDHDLHNCQDHTDYHHHRHNHHDHQQVSTDSGAVPIMATTGRPRLTDYVIASPTIEEFVAFRYFVALNQLCCDCHQQN